MKQKIKRILILAFVILLAFPVTAFADFTPTKPADAKNWAESFALKVKDKDGGWWLVPIGMYDDTYFGCNWKNDKGKELSAYIRVEHAHSVTYISTIVKGRAQSAKLVYKAGDIEYGHYDNESDIAGMSACYRDAYTWLYYQYFIATSGHGDQSYITKLIPITGSTKVSMIQEVYSTIWYNFNATDEFNLIKDKLPTALSALERAAAKRNAQSVPMYGDAAENITGILQDMAKQGALNIDDYTLIKNDITGEVTDFIYDNWKTSTYTNQQWLGWLAGYLNLFPNQVQQEANSDQQNQAGNISGNTPNAGTNTGNNVGSVDDAVWDDWYRAAYKIAAGITPTDSTWGMGAGYETAVTLIGTDKTGGYGTVSGITNDTESVEFWQKAYDVMCLAYSRGKDAPGMATWDPNGESLKHAYDMLAEVTDNAGDTAPDGVQRYSAAQTKLAELAAAGGEDVYNRMASFNERMSALYHMSTLNDVDFSIDRYSWAVDYYEKNNSSIFIPDTYFKDNTGSIPRLLVFSGSAYKANPALPKGGDSNPYVLPYLLQTVWELPYICNYMAEPMNDAIKNSTIMERTDLYNGLKSIHDTVDEMGLTVLTDMWEWETDKDGITYKSLADMWEACQKDPKVQEANSEEKTEEKDLGTGKPLGDFLADYSQKLSDNYIKGIAYTSTLVPMKSNVYSAEWLEYVSNDAEFYSDFYYLWGFNRKALYRDTSSGAGEEYFNTGGTSKGNLSVCTLRDLLDSKDDVVLYLDDNFYNANQLQHDISGYTKYDTTVEGKSTPLWWENVAERIEESYTASFTNIVKTGENTNYSKTFYEMMSMVDNAHVYYPEATLKNPGNTDNIVLNSGKINYYLGHGNTGTEIYTPLQSYAVVSSIYRDGELYTISNSRDVQSPVFISSKTAPYVTGASLEQQQTIFNYALVRNLKAAMPIDYAGNLDMDCPLYMDILGNIITESGTVVVPAISNATIMSHNTFHENMWGAGLFAIYGVDYKIPVQKNDSATVFNVLKATFEPDTSGKYYVPKPRSLGDDSYKVDMSRLSVTSKDTLDTLYNRSYGDLTNKMNAAQPLYDYNSFVQICLEVLRGAPIESIDKEAEGLNTSNRMDKAGIVAAAKLEDLNKSLGTNGENTTISLPNIAFMPGFNYVALMAFKIVLLVVILINMVTVYFDAVSESLNLRTFWKCLWAMVLTVLTVLTVPTVFEATYYQSNRALLQDETAYISMLNLEKSESGVEIGVTEVTDPDIKTQLFLKLEDVKVPWYELFYNSIYTDTFKTLNNLYDNYAQEHSAVANQSDVQIKNDGVYMDVNDIYATTSVDFDIRSDDPNARRLMQTASDKTSTFSFYSPYYALLDALIQNVNYYNANPREDGETGVQGWYSYTTKSQKGGRLKTVGLIEPYFTSSKFMEDDGKDMLGLKTIYKDLIVDTYLPDPATGQLYSASNLLAMSRSYWYPKGMTSAEVTKRIEYLNKEARTFISNNKDMLGKISDETFLKVMAMDLAIKHNRIFGCTMASSFEIYNLSSDDLIRLSIADRTDVMLNSTLSYPRFVYVVGGTSSVFAAAILSMIMWVSGVVKPLLVIVAFITIFASVFVFKICMRKEGTSLYGYIITTLLLCLTNILYSVILKLSIFLPTLGMTPFMCLIIQAIVQLVYMVVLLNVVGTAFKDWRDLGYARYAHKADDMRVSLFNFLHKDKHKSANPFYGGSSMKSDPEKNWSYYDTMMDERRRRSRDG